MQLLDTCNSCGKGGGTRAELRKRIGCLRYAKGSAVGIDIIGLAVLPLHSPGITANGDRIRLTIADITVLRGHWIEPSIQLWIARHLCELVTGNLRLTLLLSFGKVKRAPCVIPRAGLCKAGVVETGNNRVIERVAGSRVKKAVIPKSRITRSLAQRSASPQPHAFGRYDFS